MKKLFYAASALVLGLSAQGQQDPHYTQYMYNMNVMNPAYAGSKESLSGGILYRKQWVDIEDSPTTGTFFVHSPVGKNVGLGLSAVNDRIGPVEETNVYADFSYTLNLGGEHRLAFGIKGGATFHKVDFSTIYPTLPDVGDGVFASSDPNETMLNVGAGAFYYNENWYVAFSVPNMLKGKYLDYNGTSYGSEALHYFLTGGYVFQLNPDFKLKPSAMVKTSFDAPTSYDVSLNCLWMERFELGATYRREDSWGLMANVGIIPNVLRIGYAYDRIVSDLKVSTPASHEVILLFDIPYAKKVSRSPRYF